MRKDQRPPPGGRPERFAPRNWSLRTKLAIVLAVPAVLAVALGGLRILDQVSQAGELGRVSRYIDAQGQVAKLVADLQQERFQATQFVAGGRKGDVAGVGDAGTAVDAAGAAVRPVVENLFADDAALAGPQRQADQALARLPGLRTLVTDSNAPPSAVISRYTDLIGQIVQLDNTLLRGVNTTQVAGLANALSGLSVARNEASLQEALMNVVALSAEPVAGDLVDLQSSQARLQQGLGEFRGALDPGQRVRYATLIAGPTNAARTTMVAGVLAGSVKRGPDGFNDKSSAQLYDKFIGELDQADDGVRIELSSAGASARQSAVTLAAINGAVLLIALLIGAVVVGLIARQMIRSLRTLRRGALEVADARLPDAVARMRQGAVPDTEITPLAVTTREEVGQVARAFDAVHAQAVRLAAEQATLQTNVNAMFVNLSRRSQTLVDRQLKLIEELEAGEEDPDQLSNLFRLDHLATRMRRNSENLLVLAGTDLAQRAVRPVPAIEVLQAAVSEVEQYRRIVVQSPPDLAIIGRVSNDLQHLLAELLENATNFSPPESRVVMSTSRTSDGAFLVEIADQGVGMASHELSLLNEQLRKASEATVEASRRMGLFVVGRLSARHGIDVGLFAGSSVAGGNADRGASGKPGTGLTARVWIPRHLIAERPAAQPGGGAQALPQRTAAPREEVPSGPSQWSGHPGSGVGNGTGNGNGVGNGAGSAPGRRAGQPSGPGTGPNRLSGPGQPAPGGLPIRRPRPATAEPAPMGGVVEPTVRPRPPAPVQRQSPVAEPAPMVDRQPPPAPPRRPVQEPPASNPWVSGPPAARSGQPLSGPPAPAAPAVPVQRLATPPRADVPEPPAELPGSASDAQELFAASTPPTPLPDPFADERPRDPFATPEETGTPIFAEVASGWFRAYAAAAGEQAPAPAVSAVAEADTEVGSSPWERASRERAEREMAGRDRYVGADRSGAAGAGPARQSPPPPPPPNRVPSRSWPEPGEPEGRPDEQHDTGAGGPMPAPRQPLSAETWSGPRLGGQGPGDYERDEPPARPLPAQRPAPLPESESWSGRPAPVEAAQPPAQPPVQRGRAEDFVTSADSGWQAVEAVRGQSAPTEFTEAGLPRRTPLARLVPGSAATSGDSASGAPAPRRDAEAVRGRLASYQRGVRSGRENRERSADDEHGAEPAEE